MKVKDSFKDIGGVPNLPDTFQNVVAVKKSK